MLRPSARTTPASPAQAAATGSALPSAPAGHRIVQGSTHAKALLSVASGTTLTIVDSPPGAGKTTLITDMITTFAFRDDLLGRTSPSVSVVAPTRRAVADLYRRVVIALDTAGFSAGDVMVRTSLTISDLRDFIGGDSPDWSLVHEWNAKAAPAAKADVGVQTVASAGMSGGVTCDLMIFDEAYQTTFAEACNAAAGASQILMVGDPGQIGPVVTSRFGLGDSASGAPRSRAPEGFRKLRDIDITDISMPHTYRLGPETTSIVSSFYPFDFDSARPDVEITSDDGTLHPPIRTLSGETDFTDMCQQLVEEAASWIGRTLHTGTGDDVVEVTLEAPDIAIVVAQNNARSYCHGLARQAGLDGMTIGTADSLQGGQWPVVIAADPLLGRERASKHHLDLGRLCVMLSRHQGHLTWITRDDWADALDDPGISILERRRHTRAREDLDQWRSEA